MSGLAPQALARELSAAYASRRQLVAPSVRDASFDLQTAYAVEAELVSIRRAAGHRTVGRKVGYANKAVWRALKLGTLVWAHMYDDTVRFAGDAQAELSVGAMCSPKIEPEIVFKMRSPLEGGDPDPAVALGAVEWLALGFEIIDCVYPDWKYQPSDFVAAFGLHAALVVGRPRRVEPDAIPALVDDLARFTVTLSEGERVVGEGSGRNSLRSPALCLFELASAIRQQQPDEPLAQGELVSSGTLTESTPIAPGQTWTATTSGLELPALTLRTVA